MSVMEDTRDRIVASASAQIQRHGHIKTTVADVAKHCRMSPANIYRFFPTKAALIEAVSEIWLALAEDNARAIARQPSCASARVREFIVGVHEFNRDRYTRNGEVHETVVAATTERWPIVARHEKVLISIFASILEDGVRKGEFEIDDIEGTAAVMIAAMVKFHNPIMVAQYHGESLIEQANALADFMLKAIKKR
ncbi:TetR family transcriptional regulator [Parvibaculum sedimenti]|uniref:TetR family transcriptional regulator n=1 Tax=Parvibaculum sedimenti TaxID=2608632 RepID=A0A6N6VFF2_9HYPH|nr:TetR family transcriptional regulator [Parvibaculum sedimenti]KAB7739339.1 TetR family transcriptional regulator [Parvibaculum sedimenti]